MKISTSTACFLGNSALREHSAKHFAQTLCTFYLADFVESTENALKSAVFSALMVPTRMIFGNSVGDVFGLHSADKVSGKSFLPKR